jgi:hypothetical protein
LSRLPKRRLHGPPSPAWSSDSLDSIDPSPACVTAVDRQRDHAGLGWRLAARTPTGRHAKSYFRSVFGLVDVFFG